MWTNYKQWTEKRPLEIWFELNFISIWDKTEIIQFVAERK